MCMSLTNIYKVISLNFTVKRISYIKTSERNISSYTHLHKVRLATNKSSKLHSYTKIIIMRKNKRTAKF